MGRLMQRAWQPQEQLQLLPYMTSPWLQGEQGWQQHQRQQPQQVEVVGEEQPQ